jgi:hypothetical protein
VCAECFREEVADFRRRCEHCGAKRRSFASWLKTQPWLELRSAADRDHHAQQLASTATQVHMHTQHIENILLRQPAPRPFEKVAIGGDGGHSLANLSEATIAEATTGYAKV